VYGIIPGIYTLIDIQGIYSVYDMYIPCKFIDIMIIY
jgi:hypothetical protein